MELEKIEDWIPDYWEGKQNIVNRYWTYLKKGLDLITEARYLIISILGGYAVLKLTDPLWLVAMFGVSIPILTVVGRWYLIHVSKAQEFVTTVKGSVLGYKPYNISVENLEIQREILAILKEYKTIQDESRKIQTNRVAQEKY